jgi:DNA modification methylase
VTDRYVDYVRLDQVQLAPRNPKGHHGEGIAQSINHHGFAELPLLDERTGRLVAGHGRHEQLAAMHSAGHKPPDGVRVDDDGTWHMPIIRGWASRSDADAEAYLIGSNQWTIAGGWNDGDLAAVLGELAEQDLLELTGFTNDDLDALLAGPGGVVELPPAARTDPDAVPEPPVEPVTKPGDVWLLGPHRIICGDCRDHDTVAKVMDSASINVAFTSPPYASQRTYDRTSGFQPIPPDEYSDWFEDVQANVRAHLADDGSWFVNIKAHAENGQRHLYVNDLTVAHVRRWRWWFVDEFAWVNTHNGVPGGWTNRFKNAWEPVFHYSLGRHKLDALANGEDTEFNFSYRPTTPKSSTGSGFVGTSTGRDFEPGVARPSNVLHIAAAAGEAGGVHSAPFPVKLPAWFIRAYSDPGDTVFDPFMGSGSTLIAAHNEDRVGYGVEISPAYCDVSCRRFQEHTGIVPVLAATGQEHDFTGPAEG